MRSPPLPSSQRLAALCLLAFLALVARLPAQSVPYLLEPTAPSPSMRLLWQTEPGQRYDLFQSTDLRLWTHVPGFPTTASGLSLQHPFNIGPRGFFHIVPIDDQPPVVAEQFPAAAGFAVGRFADFVVRLTDATAIDPASIRLTVGSLGPLAVGAPGLTFADGTVTYDSGAAPLGAYGTTLTATLVAADTLGHTLTHTWSFKLEPAPVVASGIFVFGAAPPPPANSWSIESVAADRLVIAYTGGSAPAFTAGQKICNSAPTKVQEIFYRRILSLSDNPATSRLTLFTEDIPLTDFVQTGGVAFSASSIVYSVASDGTLVPPPPLTGTFTFPRSGFDLSGSRLKFRPDGYEATVLGVTASLGSAPPWIDITATEWSWWFTPRLRVSIELGLLGLKSFEAVASGDISVNNAFDVDLLLTGLRTETTVFDLPENLEPRHVIYMGQIGPVPVFGVLAFDFKIKSKAEAQAVIDFDFAYRQEIRVEFGLTYDRNTGLDWVKGFQATAPDLHSSVALVGKFSLEVTLEPEPQFLVYGLAGFLVNLEAHAGIEVEASTGGFRGKLTAGIDFTLAPAGPAFAFLPVGTELKIPIVEGEWPLTPQSLAFTSHPAARTAAPGAAISFTCTVDSPSPPAFQWFQNALPIPGQTARSLFLSSVTSGHAGTYHVRATAGSASANSQSAVLTVQTPTPANTDTDTDGLPNVVETNTGVWVSASNTGTNLTKWDTDGDGLRDGVETRTGVYVSLSNTGTDPNKADTDNDGMNDKAEINAGTDPNNPPAPAGMALIPGGSFAMGNSTNSSEGHSTELPVHTVSVSTFYMDRYEVTKQLWDEVRAWGSSGGRGYTDLPVGGGKATNHPVHTISWFAMVKWCNARSEKDNLTPVYYTNDAQTVIYKTGSVNVTNAQVKWGANGYRLPTEAEWEKAARGGLSGQRFPWGATITHGQANYNSSTSYAYDVSPTRGSHPTYAVGGFPYTSPVGSFAPNGYGLYDMAGNVWEGCWDWWGSGYYSTSPSSDPQGPPPGSRRVIRGGSWFNDAHGTRVANRYDNTPGGTRSNVGFRSVRR